MTSGMLRLSAVIAVLGLSACGNVLDFRPDGLDTGVASVQPTEARPPADDRGVISYPGYQVAVAQAGDTPATVATRVGLTPVELATFNGLPEQASLRPGELLALPRRVAEPSEATGAIVAGPIVPGAVDITQLAEAALDRATPTTRAAIPASASAVSGREPIRHKVERGETAFTISRLYGVSVPALAEWNALGSDLSLREGQYVLIPVTVLASPVPAVAQTPLTPEVPGAGSQTPVPPSASTPLPQEPEESRIAQAPLVRPETAPVVDVAITGETATSLEDVELPPLPDTVVAAIPAPPAPPIVSTPAPAAVPAPAPAPAPAGPTLRAPVSGSVVRGFSPGVNDGVDYAASPGASVRAADAGTVAAITQPLNDDGTPAGPTIVVVKHRGGLLTVYQNVDGLTVGKGDTVSAGQTIASVPSSDPVVHFEVRQGLEAVDPADVLQ